jgi:TetR/AcrR family transcriptional regulator, regulator of cefoperazone and chloramphenicol sensitivity
LETVLAETPIAQQRLLEAALEVFASKGYEGASTREICRLGGVNVAAIHYYFGDKASLYREVFRLPEQLRSFPAEMDDPGIPVRDVLAAFYRHITSFIVAPEQVQLQRMRLLFLREELHPSGVLEDQTDITRRMHDQVVGFLCRATGAAEPDAALHQLAFSIAGLALVLFVQRTAVDVVAPELLHGQAGLQANVERLADSALALIDAETARRRRADSCNTPKRRVARS